MPSGRRDPCRCPHRVYRNLAGEVPSWDPRAPLRPPLLQRYSSYAPATVPMRSCPALRVVGSFSTLLWSRRMKGSMYLRRR
eukprot:scaffold83967_cov72-Phaeocystis_antarctica.AAC.1